MTIERFKSGNDLTPLKPIDLSSINSFRELLEAMEKSAFCGRQLGRSYEILHDIFTDPETLVVLTLSGALTVAKQGQIICDLLDRDCIDIVVATGALLTHGIIEGMGVRHFISDDIDDAEAYRRGYCRVYDTIELESSFTSLEDMIGESLDELFPALDGKTPPSGSADFCWRLGKLCVDKFPNHRNILSSAYKKEIPVYIPAFSDCELCLDICFQHIKNQIGFDKNPFSNILNFPFNPMVDLFDYSNRIYKHESPLAIFTLGGGVPRNWAQQVAPFIDIMIKQGMNVSNCI